MRGLLSKVIFLAAGALLGGRLRKGGGRSRGRGPAPELVRVKPGDGRWRRRLWTIAGFLLVVGGAGVFVLVSGIVPIRASSGHWGITKTILEFASSRSMSFHSLGKRVPPLDSLDSPSLVLKGAGHYDFGCRPCHGSPGHPRPVIAQMMAPHAPFLPPEIGNWDAAELHEVVFHGIKFSAMPAWPSLEREDEVWAMVGFLRAMPRLDAATYRRLVHGEPASEDEVEFLRDLAGAEDEPDPGAEAIPKAEAIPEAVTSNCGRCHGVDGLGRGLGAFPKLAGQRLEYLFEALAAYARGERHSGIMEPIAAGLGEEQMRELAAYYAGLPAGRGAAPGAVPEGWDASAERGEAIARAGEPLKRIPACRHCHGPGAVLRNPVYPDLAGQYAEYLLLQLKLFQQHDRGGTPYANIMHKVVERLTEEQMRDVALYYATLTGDGPAAADSLAGAGTASPPGRPAGPGAPPPSDSLASAR